MSGIDLNDKKTFELLSSDTYEEYKSEGAEIAKLGLLDKMHITYSPRNYCGDLLYIDVLGENALDYSGTRKYMEGLAEGNQNSAGNIPIPGVDYTITCEDPDAIHLLTAEESQSKYVVGFTTETVVTADKYAAYYDSKGNFVTSGYIATKPGIFKCEVKSLSNGKTMTIVIENLPYHYENLQWGCQSQEQMDLVVNFFTNSINYGRMGQELPFTVDVEKATATGKLNGVYAYTWANWYGIDPNIETGTHEYRDAMVNMVNNAKGEFATYESQNESVAKNKGNGSAILKVNDAAFNYLCHLPQYGMMGNCLMEGWGGGGYPFNAYYGITTGKGDCETVAAVAMAASNICGLTTRYVTNSNHAWIEVMVPGEILESGQDEWFGVSNFVVTGVENSGRNINGSVRYVSEGWKF